MGFEDRFHFSLYYMKQNFVEYFAMSISGFHEINIKTRQKVIILLELFTGQ